MDIETFRSPLALKRKEFENLGVQSLFLFGSGLHKPLDSINDLDFMADFQDDKLNLDTFFMAQDLLEETFNKKIDFMTRNSLSPFIKEKIERDMVQVF